MIDRHIMRRLNQSLQQQDTDGLSSPDDEIPWTKLEDVCEITSPWVTMRCERLLQPGPSSSGTTTTTADHKSVDYWRVEKAASCVVITQHRDRLILPKRQYRPGIQKYTLDFCGGRCSVDDPEDSVRKIVHRELGVGDTDDVIESIVPLNSSQSSNGSPIGHAGWIINSSFSNQLLFGYAVRLRDEVILDEELYLHPISYDTDGFELLETLSCLQCRAVLMEWMIQKQMLKKNRTNK